MFSKNSIIKFLSITALYVLFAGSLNAQQLMHLNFREDVNITIDQPSHFTSKLNTQLVFFALPNGNTTAQTMGKLIDSTDDWHYDIQHIAAQTAFLRNTIYNENIIVVYLENTLKAWPAWKGKHADHIQQIQSIIDTTIKTLALKKFTIHLNGHSGGGSFIFGYLAGVDQIPSMIKRITFIDSNYGYDSSYTSKFTNWLSSNSGTQLTVFAYNDSIALYNGKPFVSATGGTWYKSHQMIKDLSANFSFHCSTDTIIHCTSLKNRINFFLKENPSRLIFHTQQVELNGFIHSVLIGTKHESKGYIYFGKRSYTAFLKR